MDCKKTLQDLAQVLIDQKKLTRKDAEEFVRLFFDTISEQVVADGIVKVKGLGTFKMIDVQNRESVDVNTGERIIIPGHAKVSFTPDNTLKDTVNKPFADFQTVIINEGTSLEDMERMDYDVPSVPSSDDEEPKTFAEEKQNDAVEQVDIPAEEPIVQELVSAENTLRPVETLPEEPVEHKIIAPAEESEQAEAKPEESVSPIIAEEKPKSVSPSPSVDPIIRSSTYKRDITLSPHSYAYEREDDSDNETFPSPAFISADSPVVTDSSSASSDDVLSLMYSSQPSEELPEPEPEEEVYQTISSNPYANPHLPTANEEVVTPDVQQDPVIPEVPEVNESPIEEPQLTAEEETKDVHLPEEPVLETSDTNDDNNDAMPNTASSDDEIKVEPTTTIAETGSSVFGKVGCILAVVILMVLSYMAGYYRWFIGDSDSSPVLTQNESLQATEPDMLDADSVESNVFDSEPEPVDSAQFYKQVPGSKYVIIGFWKERVVERGEYLMQIARKEYHDNDASECIVAFNDFKNPSNLPVGTVIRLPKLKLVE